MGQDLTSSLLGVIERRSTKDVPDFTGKELEDYLKIVRRQPEPSATPSGGLHMILSYGSQPYTKPGSPVRFQLLQGSHGRREDYHFGLETPLHLVNAIKSAATATGPSAGSSSSTSGSQLESTIARLITSLKSISRTGGSSNTFA